MALRFDTACGIDLVDGDDAVPGGAGERQLSGRTEDCGPPPAPRVSQQVISAASTGDPPPPMFKGQVVSEGQPDH